MWLLIVLLLADTSRAFSIALAPAESVWVTVEGVGDPVVLIPGLFGSAFGYRTVLPRLVEAGRSEEHTSELQSLRHLVCRLLLEKKKYSSRVHICLFVNVFSNIETNSHITGSFKRLTFTINMPQQTRT